MNLSFKELVAQAKEAALDHLERQSQECAIDKAVDEALEDALKSVLPGHDHVSGDWIMQMMWQVPHLLEPYTYSDGMDVNATVYRAIGQRIGDALRHEILERAGELGFVPGGMRI